MTQTEALKLALEALYFLPALSPAQNELQDAAIEAIKEALAQPEPSPEWMTEEEQTAYTFGWFKALEQQRLAQPKEPEQEPVAWWNGNSKFATPKAKDWDKRTGGTTAFGCDIPLYTTPYVATPRPQRKPLTDEQHLFEDAPQRTAAESEDTRSSAATLCRAWVGLTDEEINDLVHNHDDFDGLWEFTDAVEAKLKEKNTRNGGCL